MDGVRGGDCHAPDNVSRSVCQEFARAIFRVLNPVWSPVTACGGGWLPDPYGCANGSLFAAALGSVSSGTRTGEGSGAR